MSTFAVFGMTREQAVADARKRVKATRQTPGGEVAIPMTEWLALCERRADETMAGTKTKQLSPMFDAPQFAQDFIAVARRTLQCRDMHIKCRVPMTDALGNPLMNRKTGVQKVGWKAHGSQSAKPIGA
ncbi:hypothetical protein [Pseudomonas sp. UBA6310]|uniref:hypothetical protein n=1 Tax=Pseudomonas sp. UBA6310 TaxID=1947327 RepID=UPI00257CC0B3|nr:hypothetical protein [Pseudomonas sp. UBA6310]